MTHQVAENIDHVHSVASGLPDREFDPYLDDERDPEPDDDVAMSVFDPNDGWLEARRCRETQRQRDEEFAFGAWQAEDSLTRYYIDRDEPAPLKSVSVDPLDRDPGDDGYCDRDPFDNEYLQ